MAEKKKDGGFDKKEEKIAFEASPTDDNWHPDKEILTANSAFGNISKYLGKK